MDSQQLKVIKEIEAGAGFKVEDMPPKTLVTIPKATYYKVFDGVVREFPNLPADPISLRRYKNKGFSVIKPKLPETINQIPKPEIPKPKHRRRKSKKEV